MALTLEEIISGIAEYIGDDKDRAKDLALQVFRNDATQPVAQHLINRGAGKRAGELQTKIVELESKLADVQAEIKDRDEEIATLRSAEPGWGEKLKDTEARLGRKISQLTEERDAERQARKNDKLSAYRERFVARLGPGTQVDKDWAETVLAHKFADRFRLTDAGDLEVLEVGETTPYDTGGDPDKAIDLLVQDVLRTVPGKYRILGAPSGGGGTGGGAGTETKPKTDAEVQQRLRQVVGYASP